MGFLIYQKTPEEEKLRVINNRLELTKGFYVLLLANVPHTDIYLAIIISEKDWCSHQSKDTKHGKINGRVEGVKIAHGKEGQELELIEADLLITDDFGKCWQLNAGELTLHRVGCSNFLGEESKIRLNVIHSAF